MIISSLPTSASRERSVSRCEHTPTRCCFLPLQLTIGADYKVNCVGCHPLVPCARGPARFSPLLDSDRHVVCRLHLRRDDHARPSSVPWRLRNRSDLQDFQVCLRLAAALVPNPMSYFICRILGTPNDENWPGIKQLPDYKDSFPHWNPQDLADHIPNLDDDGLDLLKVRTSSRVQVMHNPTRLTSSSATSHL